MQNYYYLILVNDQPWQDMKIWNLRSAEVHLKHITDYVTHHIDYRNCKHEIKLIKVDEVIKWYVILEQH
jgi:hypothetical protein